jgi:hypothetical protein
MVLSTIPGTVHGTILIAAFQSSEPANGSEFRWHRIRLDGHYCPGRGRNWVVRHVCKVGC